MDVHYCQPSHSTYVRLLSANSYSLAQDLVEGGPVCVWGGISVPPRLLSMLSYSSRKLARTFPRAGLWAACHAIIRRPFPWVKSSGGNPLTTLYYTGILFPSTNTGDTEVSTPHSRNIPPSWLARERPTKTVYADKTETDKMRVIDILGTERPTQSKACTPTCLLYWLSGMALRCADRNSNWHKGAVRRAPQHCFVNQYTHTLVQLFIKLLTRDDYCCLVEGGGTTRDGIVSSVHLSN